ncbi:hypothetical protein FACS189426_20720 [Bacteroidia bacterium]|nr:hypothetical protein FACS189426_20720 [Bacteroidia bacterium]GHV70299.1 hypothetical protein FACS189420_0810 [Bacteroidia bacterium]
MENKKITKLQKYDLSEKLYAKIGKFVVHPVVFDTSNVEEKSFWNRFNRQNKIPNPKRRKNYPAIKIGRLAVSEKFEKQGIGGFILDSVKNLLLGRMDVACRFITVDAYQTAFHFYQKNGFEFLSTQDENDSTRLMYFDLKHILNKENE